MSATFRNVIRWPANPLLLPPEYFGVRVPTGLCSLDVRAPNFVDIIRMSQLVPVSGRGPGGGLALVNGLVTRSLTPALANPGQLAIRRTAGAPAPTNGPLDFQFQGGEIVLTLELGIYILNS